MNFKSEFGKQLTINSNINKIESLKEDLKIAENIASATNLPQITIDMYVERVDSLKKQIAKAEQEIKSLKQEFSNKTKFEKRTELSTIILSNVDLRKKSDVKFAIVSFVAFNNSIHEFIPSTLNLDVQSFKEMKDLYQKLKSLAMDEIILNLR